MIFVIDGAHRLSAFMAWINDDYGDREISNEFYGGKISDEQLELAKKARQQIEKEIGKYSIYQDAFRNTQKYSDDIVRKARGLETFAFDIQWIEGDVSVAEKSFFNINQKAVPINPTELKILEARNKPIGIAARAIAYLRSSRNGAEAIKQQYPNINLVNEEIVTGNEFNLNRKSETYISTALKSVVRCAVCGGVVIHVNATSVDHIIRKREGGLGSVENGQITYPYCNTGYKN